MRRVALGVFLWVEAGDEGWGGGHGGADVDAADVGGEGAFGVFAPGGDGALGFGALAEDEADEDVEAAEREEEEGGDEGEVVDVVREDCGTDPEIDVLDLAA